MTMGSDKHGESDNRRVTLREIGQRVGFSHVTVGRALADKAGVGRETRDRIRAVAREMGYRTDPVMSQMMRHMRDASRSPFTETIGVILQNSSDRLESGFRETLDGIAEQANRMGYAIDSFTVGENGYAPERLREVLNARGIRGILLVALTPTALEGESFRDFLRVKLPVPSEKPGVVYVGRNPYSAYQKIFERLQELGLTRVGFAKRERIRGIDLCVILGALEMMAPRPSRREEPEFEPLFVYDENAEDTTERMRAWVEANRLDAVVGGAAAFPFLRNIGRAIPEEIGFACTNLSSELPYSGVNSPSHAVGRESVRVMDNLITAKLYGRPEDTEVVLVPPVWQDGNTLLPRSEMTR